ncbi:MFS general substrate transporter [Stipitochalara longipes BDJ]|nr:MFS general substrate transporter [Stipitochalara longipes BDJ]
MLFFGALPVACTAACSSFGTLLAVRIILGVLEAVISPALVLITGTWYQRKEASPRYGIWYCGLGGGQILGGAVNAVVGILVVLFLPGKPQVATFLSSEEKRFVLDRLVVNQSGIENNNEKPRQIFEARKGAQIWLLCLITVFCSLSSGVITTFSATLVKGFGYDGKQSALLNISSGVISILRTMFATIAVGRGYARWASIVILVVPVIIGGLLMSQTTAILVIVYSWVGSNVTGHTQNITANGMVAASFVIANIIGPQTFQAHDAPYFPLGELISLDLTDWENKHFRYTY